jgi:hypothetical protein
VIALTAGALTLLQAGRAEAALERGDFAEACRAAQDATPGERAVVLARVYYRGGDPVLAQEAARTGLVSDPWSLPLRYYDAACAVWLEDSEAATEGVACLESILQTGKLDAATRSSWQGLVEELRTQSAGLAKRHNETARALGRMRAVAMAALGLGVLLAAWGSCRPYATEGQGRSRRPVS